MQDRPSSSVNSGACGGEASPADVPLVVDLDGTLLKTDTLHESLFHLLAQRPLRTLFLPLWLLKGKAFFKARTAESCAIDPARLPLNDEVVRLIEIERAKGRQVYLASAANERLVEAIARQVGTFDGYFASGEQRNLIGKAKAERLCEVFGKGGFDYAGNSASDMDVWDCARHSIVVSRDARLLDRIKRKHPSCTTVACRPPAPLEYLRALRVYQWAKNMLLFVPMAAANQITLENFVVLAIAFIAFSLVASSVYVVNDLFDLSSDRDHEEKRFRPFASGSVPLMHGPIIAAILLSVGCVLAKMISGAFLLTVLVYLALTLAYTLLLKRKPIIDVLTLAGLYTIRVVAGAAALHLPVSEWFLAFSMFLFLCLALMKRFSELRGRLDRGAGDPDRRGYRLDDLQILTQFAAASGYAAVLVFALYINSPEVRLLQSRPELLWLVCVLLLYWITRALLSAYRGLMDVDPIVFAFRDRVSLATIVLAGIVVFASGL